MKGIHIIAFLLLVIGGLNWGLTAVGYNVVHIVLKSWPQVEKIVYILVGLSALFEIVGHKKGCRTCNPTGTPTV